MPSIRTHSGSKLILVSCHTDRPDRWKSPPEAISENPGVWSNLMTFLGGARACIGYQFTLVELVCYLLRLVHIFWSSLTIFTPAG